MNQYTECGYPAVKHQNIILSNYFEGTKWVNGCLCDLGSRIKVAHPTEKVIQFLEAIANKGPGTIRALGAGETITHITVATCDTIRTDHLEEIFKLLS